MSLKAVLFDLDGTLLDTAPDFKTSLNLLLHEEGKAPLTEEEVKVMVSHGSADLIANAFQISSKDPAFEPLRARLLTFYLANLSKNTRYFDGIESSLEFIAEQGLGYGIVTNKPMMYAEKILEDLHIKVDCLVCPDQVNRPKPDPEAMFYACDKIGYSPSECIFVGDHVRDIIAGRDSGMPTVAAAYGYIPANESVEDWQADYIIHQPSELRPILEKLI